MADRILAGEKSRGWRGRSGILAVAGMSLAVAAVLSGCGGPATPDLRAEVLDRLAREQTELVGTMRRRMADSFFMTSLVVLAATLFGPAVMEEMRAHGARWFRLSPERQKEWAVKGYCGLIVGTALGTWVHPDLAEIRLSVWLLLAGTLVPFVKDYLPGIESGDPVRRKLGASRMKVLFLYVVLYWFILKLLSEEGIGGLTLARRITSGS